MLLSIIIPVYNEKKLVCQLLEKVIAFDPANVVTQEIIVVDDGFTDGTRRVIEKLLKIRPDAGVRMRSFWSTF